eukprot:m.25520 g.25520  ORF g.25520 m.25520 type:complete len:147 (-) comp11520_c0_seq1:2011-2451(-)
MSAAGLRGVSRRLDSTAVARRVKKRIEKLEEDCGANEQFGEVTAAAPVFNDGDDKKIARGKKKRRKLSATSQRFRRTLNSLIVESKIEDAPEGTPTYLRAVIGPSLLPARKLCAVTGFEAKYKCMYDDAPVADLKALESYLETRCK